MYALIWLTEFDSRLNTEKPRFFIAALLVYITHGQPLKVIYNIILQNDEAKQGHICYKILKNKYKSLVSQNDKVAIQA